MPARDSSYRSSNAGHTGKELGDAPVGCPCQRLRETLVRLCCTANGDEVSLSERLGHMDLPSRKQLTALCLRIFSWLNR
ncbi:hypothetical protein ACWIFK_33890 [Streptomyces althioticus]|uniref:hypothetical protein n=1 Tax=Streptomyces althioticus TaxID=83380 RepID=UPI0018736C71|nr:hypothetical protein GCM10010250_69290 [Streptomyces althioticus]